MKDVSLVYCSFREVLLEGLNDGGSNRMLLASQVPLAAHIPCSLKQKNLAANIGLFVSTSGHEGTGPILWTDYTAYFRIERLRHWCYQHRIILVSGGSGTHSMLCQLSESMSSSESN